MRCKTCNEPFLAQPNKIKIGRGKYCSRKCSADDKPNAIDLTGRRFRKLLVLSRVVRPGRDGIRWLVRCDCGKEKLMRTEVLRHSKRTVACGCHHYKTHGLSRTTENTIWRGMTRRCTNKNDISWKYYGGRGISICKRWSKFENFLADMGKRPSRNHSIDRINNDGNYEPGNCRWATSREQHANKRAKGAA